MEKNRKDDRNKIIGFLMPAKVMLFVKDGSNITQVYKQIYDKSMGISPNGIAKSLTLLLDRGYLIKKKITEKGFSKRDRYLFLTPKGMKLQKDVRIIHKIIEGWEREKDKKSQP